MTCGGRKFAYSDVESESTWTVTRLTPGADYYFIVGRKHDGGVTWPVVRRVAGTDAERR